MLDAAIAAADPARGLAALLPAKPKGRVVVVGAGKASAAMAAAVEAAWGEVEGVVVVPDGHRVPTRSIAVLEASHPVPDARSEAAARRILSAVQRLGPDDLVLALISGGGSALMALPAPGLTLADKQAVNRSLLASGATIHEMNCVRKHLSAIKGGRLAAAAHPAKVVTIAISDVPGDDPAVIASGPTVADPTTYAEARAILARYRIELPPAVAAHLARAEDETPKPGDPRLASAEFRFLATPFASLTAAAEVAREHGFTPLILGDAIEGEAAVVGTAMAGIARSVREHGVPIAPPCVLLSGGETTVTVQVPSGRGGRNTTFLLGLALALAGRPGIWAIAADSDGKDGNLEAAGATVAPDTLARARTLGLDPRAMLAANDAGTFFDRLGDLVVTGPTLTNVNDIRAIVIA
ncbi:MAG: glycerate kinase [Acetobacteraceae bacterium]|nr:glycerate kinase [Acetobacteraceae bacterium]